MTKKIKKLLFLTLLILVFAGGPVIAQVCGTDIITSGNVQGHAMSDNLGPIYLSTESWNDIHTGNTTTEEFSVEYDRQTNSWSGKAWNEQVGWINFGQTGPRTAIIENASNPAWGNLDPIIDLSDVYYYTDGNQNPTNSGQAGFGGYTTNGDYTATNGNENNDYAPGMGNIHFHDASLMTEPNPCNEYVDLTLNGVNSLYSETCPISAPTIRWTTNNIVSGSCEVTSGDWAGNASTRPGTSGQETAGSGVTDTARYQLFTLTCEGEGSGNERSGSATISCGTDPETVTDPTDGATIPTYQEV